MYMANNDARIDRAVLLAGLWAATRGSQAERVRLAVACASAGARHASAQQSLAALLGEIDSLESTLIEKLAESGGDSMSPRELLGGARRLHECCARMRAAAIAGFSHAAASAARKRARGARHDIINSIGTVRNAILLMDDEPDPASREHFRAMAKRNAVTSEQLVRMHLSDDASCYGAFAASADDAESLVASELTPCADRECTPDTVAALWELAALTGVALDVDESSGGLRVTTAASRGNQRHDLGRASQREDVDTVGL
jgi:hypothetical protein